MKSTVISIIPSLARKTDFYFWDIIYKLHHHQPKLSLCKLSIYPTKMIPSDIFAEDFISMVIRYGLYIGAAFQIACLVACVTLTDDQTDNHQYEKCYTDSDECSSEQSSPGHRATTARSRRHDKKKRR